MHLATKIALIGVSSGILLSCLQLVIAGSDLLASDISLIAFVYGFAAAGAVLFERFHALRPWVLTLAGVPLLLWTIVGSLGAGDPTSILAFLLYTVAIAVAFRTQYRQEAG